MARRPRRNRRTRRNPEFTSFEGDRSWDSPLGALAAKSYYGRTRFDQSGSPAEKDSFVNRVMERWQGGESFYRGQLDYQDTWRNVNLLIGYAGPDSDEYTFFQGELRSFDLDALFGEVAREMTLGRAGKGETLRFQYEEVGERKPHVVAALKRMQLIQPVVYQVFAWHIGHEEEVPGVPFDRVPSVMHRGELVHPRSLPKAAHAAYKKSRSGRAGRKAWEKSGYTPAAMSKLTGIPKKQIQSMIAGALPLFKQDMELFEMWTPDELHWLLLDEQEMRFTPEDRKTYAQTVQAATSRTPGGWKK